MKNFLNRITPFILFGVAVVAFSFGIILLAYLLFFGAILGFGLFFIAWVRNKFFASKLPTPKRPQQPKQGRTFDSDDWKEL